MSLLCALDTETTGLDQADGHRIIEVNMQVFDLATRERKVNFTQRINPERSISPAAQAVHHISLADLAGKPTWNTVAPRIQLILSKCVVAVAHNAEFDLPFIGMELMRIGMKVPTIDVFCTMESGRWATPTGKLPSLKELCFACDVPYDPEAAHAADYDVDRMVECLWKGADWGFFKLPATIEERIAA